MPNYGLVVKLRDDYEDGSKERSYYTKGNFAQEVHFEFLPKKPQMKHNGIAQ